MTKEKSNNENGRSMVEMLGVLAVIGVLSVAGIAGYSIAMQSHRTNEILNATSMFYVLAMSQNQGNGPSEKIAYSNVGGTNPSGATLEYENNAITITFNDAKDCTAAKNKLGDKATGDCTNKKLTVKFTDSSQTGPTDEEIMARIDEIDAQVGSNFSKETKEALFPCFKAHLDDYKDPFDCCYCILNAGIDSCSGYEGCQEP